MNIEALRSQLSALDPTHPSIKHSVERIQREIAMSDGPDDIPDTVYLKAAQVVVGFPRPFKSEADTGKAITLVARAIMAAEKRGEERERQACAQVAVDYTDHPNELAGFIADEIATAIRARSA